ncbi:MAG: ATP-binding protein [Isosphaeraceae bacterium]|nr:ATP-binding protein [Isosphaeraceae bacterium]
MASFFVIQGADQGKRFELDSRNVTLGRDRSNQVRLHDNEVSRKHAEVHLHEGGYRLIDTGSANGTFLNGQVVQDVLLRSGDQIRVGQTLMLFDDAAGEAVREMTARVQMLARESPDDRSAILRSIPVGEGSRVLSSPAAADGSWLRDRLAGLSVMYKAAQTISQVTDLEALLPQILELVFESIGADRGAILLIGPEGELVPKAVRWRGEAEPDERMSISRTIVEHVISEGQGVLTGNPSSDARFTPGQSFVDFGIVEAVCVPVQGRHATLGVIYADVRSTPDFHPSGKLKRRLNQDHLMLMVAIGHQAGMAIENTELYQAKIQAERLAAVGQTIAALSHHIKNILQGMRAGAYLVDDGLSRKDETIIRRGWSAVEKNQNKIFNLVMDMLSYSKDREPAFESADLNETVEEVVELMRPRAAEFSVDIAFEPAEMPRIDFDPEGIHRAVLNIVTNAIDAAEPDEGERGHVHISTAFDRDAAVARVHVRDDGPGIPEGKMASIFELFASTKGSRGTGLGLPVSRKIVLEHGGEIVVDSKPGEGACFTIVLPLERPPSARPLSEEFDGLD